MRNCVEEIVRCVMIQEMFPQAQKIFVKSLQRFYLLEYFSLKQSQVFFLECINSQALEYLTECSIALWRKRCFAKKFFSK